MATLHLSCESLNAIQEIIKLMSTKEDKPTMRDVVCISVGELAAKLCGLHDSTKAIYTTDKEQRKKNQEKWRRVQKVWWTESLAQTRSHYCQLPRGRRPKGWTPPSDEPEWTPEEAKRAYSQAFDEHDRVQAQKERDGTPR
ncbi:hypothetical protein BBC27_12020 [Acidithiobacillus ferrivorans]|uniref:Uncharacterized protein n=1 Tax=Acidithiobacillus ferrivorans TaxID=160808 RepID=A0A1B9BYC7_9PROT|nr:hypothetical protein BBC27_12020 [Acidithiobacillus ferrivorans]